MADGIQLGAAEQAAPGTDGNASVANAPGAGEKSSAMMARPEWVPEKFFKEGVIDYKGMASSYSELEKKQGSSSAEPTADEQPKPEEKPAQPVAAIPGVAAERVTHFTTEIGKDGKLSDASYAELAQLGYPKPVVDAYVRGLNADQEIAGAQIAAKQIDEIKSLVGGDAELGKMLGWAKAEWSEADQKVYNDAVGSKDVAKVKMAVQGLKAAYAEANGEQPNYLNLGGNSRPAGKGGLAPFSNEMEVADAMRDPRYSRSETYRQEVASRLKVSDVFKNSRDVTKVQR